MSLNIVHRKFGCTLNYKINSNVPLKFEIHSFIGIVSNNFSLQPIIIERIEYIFNELWNHYHEFFNVIRYENAIIGIMIFAHEEFYQYKGVDYTPIDITDFIEDLFGKKNTPKNLIQVYTVYQTVYSLV
jgi:hypothetical protein